MSLKKITVSVSTAIERVLNQMENHEAVAESALRDLQCRLAQAVAQLRRLERIGCALEREHATAQQEATRWRSRAKASSNDEQAIECLRRCKQGQQRLKELCERLTEQRELEVRLRRDIELLEQRFRALVSRRDALRARESRARAFELVSAELAVDAAPVEDVFERWETTVVEREYLSVTTDDWDALEAGLASQEERDELLRQLKELRGES